MERLLERVWGARGSGAQPDGTRSIVCIPRPEDKVPFKGNKISTTKYNIFTFWPKALYEQFRRVANLYFTFVAALSLTPLSPVTPFTTISPLVLVIGLSIAKEALEDWKRAQADSEVNSRLVDVYAGSSELESRPWRSLRVGEVVRVKKNAFFPADLLFLSSSNPEGACYVETMNLDGETNLKVRKCVERSMNIKRKELERIRGAEIVCENPNPSLYTFVGNLKWNSATTSLNPLQILLRGSSLRNTDYVYGLCIFTGHDTKVMMNQTDPPSKRSTIERQLDFIIIFMFFLLFLMSFVSALVFGVRTNNEAPNLWYLRPESSTVLFDPKRSTTAGALMFLTSLTLYGFFIPISLYVSIEIVKIIQAKMMNQDIHMYHSESNRAANARTSNLNEELGQLQIILSDKTGTLTRNQMEFFKCSIAGVSYGRGVTEVERATARRLGKPLPAESVEEGSNRKQPLFEKGFNLVDDRLMHHAWAGGPNSNIIRRFFEVLAVCQTAIPEGEPTREGIRYMAESPDEASFVVAAKILGFFFYKRTASEVWVRESKAGRGEEDRKYEIVNVLEFNSTRKRMSVITRTPEGELLLMCKGADSVIYERLGAQGKMFKDVTSEHMTTYGDAGLRTLAIAYAPLQEARYQDWQRRWVEAKQTITTAEEQASRLEALAEEIERDLILLGSTAIEDKLQVGVPEAIESMAKAGLKIWVLTGDKLETAINIGYACSLLRKGMDRVTLQISSQDFDNAEEAGDKGRARSIALDILRTQLDVGLEKVSHPPDRRKGDGEMALIIDGKALLYTIGTELEASFLSLSLACVSVICCRVSPKQKAQVTKLVKVKAKMRCLGIGDGANDVGMIQNADIGVGISGFEGQQAVMASDFAIAQFRFLERLLLVHGAWCYKRISRMVCYFFYKNITFGLTMFWFNSHAFFSGQAIYHSWYLTLYNVVFTSLPVICLGIFDQDVSAQTHLRFPPLYQQGQNNSYFSIVPIAAWMVNGLWQSLVCYYFMASHYERWSDRKTGRVMDLFGAGTVLYTCVVFTVNCQIALAINYWTWVHHLAIWGSMAIWIIFLLFIGGLPLTFSEVGVARKLFVEVVAPTFSYWLVVLLVIVTSLLPDFILRASIRWGWPEDHHIVQEMEAQERKTKSRNSGGVAPHSPPRTPIGRTASNAASHQGLSHQPTIDINVVTSLRANSASTSHSLSMSRTPNPHLPHPSVEKFVCVPGSTPHSVEEIPLGDSARIRTVL